MTVPFCTSVKTSVLHLWAKIDWLKQMLEVYTHRKYSISNAFGLARSFSMLLQCSIVLAVVVAGLMHVMCLL